MHIRQRMLRRSLQVPGELPLQMQVHKRRMLRHWKVQRWQPLLLQVLQVRILLRLQDCCWRGWLKQHALYRCRSRACCRRWCRLVHHEEKGLSNLR